MVKVVRLRIIKPVELDWEVLGKALNECSYEVMQLRNRAMREYYLTDKVSREHYKRTGESMEYVLNGKKYSLSGYIYALLTDTCHYANSEVRSAVFQDVNKKWKGISKDVNTGKMSLPTYKQGCPIEISSRSIKLEYDADTDNFYLVFRLLSKVGSSELGLANGVFKVLVAVEDKSKRTILERCVDGIYSIAGSKIMRVKNKWVFNLSYSFEPQVTNTLDKDTILGVDMGIVYPVYMAVSNSYAREKIVGGEIEAFRKRIVKRKNELYQQAKYCGQGRVNHGTKKRIEPICKIGSKEADARDTFNHKYAKFVVQTALKYGCGTIQMEDLSGIAVDNKFLQNWTYFDLQTKIINKAKEVGIEVVLIDPAYTSQRCHKCGCIHSDNRKTQSEFECIACGYKGNADYNAAKNISIRDIAKIIKETMSKK